MSSIVQNMIAVVVGQNESVLQQRGLGNLAEHLRASPHVTALVLWNNYLSTV
mgnify:CR=1 FL=1